MCYTLVQFKQVLAEVNNKERGLETTETARIIRNHSRYPGVVIRVGKTGDGGRFQQRAREPLGCYS